MVLRFSRCRYNFGVSLLEKCLFSDFVKATVKSRGVTFISCYLISNQFITAYRWMIDSPEDAIRNTSGGIFVVGDVNARVLD